MACFGSPWLRLGWKSSQMKSNQRRNLLLCHFPIALVALFSLLGVTQARPWPRSRLRSLAQVPRRPGLWPRSLAKVPSPGPSPGPGPSGPGPSLDPYVVGPGPGPDGSGPGPGREYCPGLNLPLGQSVALLLGHCWLHCWAIFHFGVIQFGWTC